MKCTNCGKEVEADALFCDECGASMAVEAAVATESVQEAPKAPEETTAAPVANAFCISCGAAIPAGSGFCEVCGANQSAPVAQEQKPAKKKAPVGIIIGAVAAVVIVSVCLVPVVEVACYALFYQVLAAVTEPISDKRLTGVITQAGEGIGLLVKVLFTVCAMFLLTIAIVCVTTGGIG